MVDTFLTPVAAEELIKEIQTRTTQPILYAVNSHYHLDHSGGGYTVVYVPDANVVFTGDLGWSKTLPNLVDAPSTSGSRHWIDSSPSIRRPGSCPANGMIADSGGMESFRNYLFDLRARVKQAIDGGLTAEQAKNN